MVLPGASVDAGGTVPLHGEAIARFWLLLVGLHVASSALASAIARRPPVVTFNSVALRELIKLEETTIIAGGLMPRLGLLVRNVTAVVLLLVLLLDIEEIDMGGVLQEALLEGCLLLVVELLARSVALGLRGVAARLHVVEPRTLR